MKKYCIVKAKFGYAVVTKEDLKSCYRLGLLPIVCQAKTKKALIEDIKNNQYKKHIKESTNYKTTAEF